MPTYHGRISQLSKAERGVEYKGLVSDIADFRKLETPHECLLAGLESVHVALGFLKTA